MLTQSSESCDCKAFIIPSDEVGCNVQSGYIKILTMNRDLVDILQYYRLETTHDVNLV